VRGPVELVARQARALSTEEETHAIGIVGGQGSRRLERQPRNPGGRRRIDGDERAQAAPGGRERRGRPRLRQDVERAPGGAARVIAEVLLSILGKRDEKERSESEVLDRPRGETGVGGSPGAHEEEMRPGILALGSERRISGGEAPIASGRHRRDSTRRHYPSSAVGP